MTRFALALLITLLATRAHADPAADRAAVADSLTKLAASADTLGRTAKASDDRGVRKKFAAQATELGDDLNALARRVRKDAPVKTIAKDIAAIDKDATALIDLADDAEDKAERKALRGQATLLEQGVASVKKTVETLGKDDDKQAKPVVKPAAMSPADFKRLLEAVEGVNTDRDKLAVVRQAGDANWFTAAQIVALMDLINVDSVKVDVASTLWPHLVDPQNGFAIFAKLELEGSKAELHRRVGK